MTRQVADYVALALIARLSNDDVFSSSRDFAGDFQQLRNHAEERCGFKITDAVVHEMIRSLADCGLVRVSEDAYAGTYYKIRATQFRDFVQRAEGERAQAISDYGNEGAIQAAPSDFPAASGLLKHEVFEDYQELGDTWLLRALDGLRKQVGDGALEGGDGQSAILPEQSSVIPASDRLVSIDHNSLDYDNIVQSTEAAAEAVRSSNTLDEDSRGWIRAHLQAGLELIRSHKILASAASALLLSPLLKAYEAVAEEPAKQAILAAIMAVRSFFGLS